MKKTDQEDSSKQGANDQRIQKAKWNEYRRARWENHPVYTVVSDCSHIGARLFTQNRSLAR
jgi:hypothetical protein